MINIGNIKSHKYYKLTLILTFIAGISLGALVYSLPYEMKIDNEVIGILDSNSKEYLENHIMNFESVYEEVLEKDISSNNIITFEKQFLFKKKDNIDKFKTSIENNVQFDVDAFCINVNGNDIAYLIDESSAVETLNLIKEAYSKKYKDSVEKVSFQEDIKILEKKTNIFDIITKESAFNYFLTGNKKLVKHFIERPENEDTSVLYASENNKLDNETDINKSYPREFVISSRSMSYSNNDTEKKEDDIDEENISAAQPILNVEIINNVTVTERIPYQAVYEKTSSLYKGQSKTKVAGSEGEKEVTYKITTVNGEQTNKEKISENIIKDSVNKVILKGTKEKPKTAAYGIFKMPTNGIITSRFGPRNGGFHRGVDIANRIGTSVKAADGGKVIFSGWSGNYGKIVKIDHGNGYVTYYAHNNKLSVKAGDSVYRGQKIAEMGVTGRVTGSHLHFEILKNGNNVNPLNYIK